MVPLPAPVYSTSAAVNGPGDTPRRRFSLTPALPSVEDAAQEERPGTEDTPVLRGGEAVQQWAWGGLLLECAAVLVWAWSKQLRGGTLQAWERWLTLAHLLLLAVVLALAMAAGDWGP